jgi:hypothetical protein
MINFKRDTTLTIIEEFDEKHEEVIAQSEETFKAGERVDASVTTQDGPFCELQFADGCVAFAVERDSFTVLPDISEQQRRDEKHGAYGGEVDIAN